MKKFFLLLLTISFFVLSVFVLAAEQVDINTASLQELEKLTGIGPAYAQRIIESRPFSSIDGLLKVSGIGEKTLQNIKDQGLACVDCPEPEPGEVAPPATLPIDYPGGIFINEIMPSPEGSDETNEWIELYNSNNFDIDLSGWKIQDIHGTIKTYTIPKNTKISANGFLIFQRPETKIILNNDQDALNLFAPDGKIVDSAEYIKAPLGRSYNKINSGWQWSVVLTPSFANTVAVLEKNDEKNLSKSQKADKNNTAGLGLANISQSIGTNQENIKTTSPWFLFFTALVITIVSAATVLFIKLKYNKTQH